MSSYQVHVLKEGFCNYNPDGTFCACGTVSLAMGKHNILVDTGGPRDKACIIEGLKRHGLEVEDVDHVVGTHGHSDHVGNLNLFPEATFIVSHDIHRGDTYLNHDFNKEAYKIDEQVEVISTPGHTGSDVSVVVKGSPNGTTVIAGDLFESEEDIEEPNRWRVVSENEAAQEKSRRAVIGLADYIVPGHGRAFKVTDQHRQKLRDGTER